MTFIKKTEGGAIGARRSGVVARINMDRWKDKMLVAIERMKLEVYLFTKYVDDIDMAISIVPEGWM